MDRHALEYLEKTYQVRDLTSDKWIPAIFAVLREGPRHYMELLRTIEPVDPTGGWDPNPPKLSSKMLSQTLRDVVDDGLLIKTSGKGVFPPSSIYELAPPARELADEGPRMIAWANRYVDLLERAGERRRRKRLHTND